MKKLKHEKQSERLVAWVTPSEKKIVLRAAKTEDLTPSSFVREAAMREAIKFAS